MKHIFLVPLFFALGEIPVPVVQQISQLGALGVLSWFCFSQDKELKSIRKTHANTLDNLCDRWDSWQKDHHDDSIRLNDTLRAMVAQCERRNAGEAA
jgi:hypothetical protein